MPDPPKRPKAKSQTPSGPSGGTRSASASSMGSIEDFLIPSKPIDEEAFKKADMERKMDLMAAALNKLGESFNTKMDRIKTTFDSKLDDLESKIDSKMDPLWEAVFQENEGLKDRVTKLDETVFEEEEGLQTKMAKVEEVVLQEDTGLKDKVIALEKSAEDINEKYDKLSKEMDDIRYEHDVAKRLLCQHDQSIKINSDKIIDLTAKSMEKNITISGIPESTDEDPKEVATEFLQTTLRIQQFPTGGIIKEAFRLGQSNPTKPRSLVIKCSMPLRELILKAAAEYRERLGRNKPEHYISTQIPDKMVEQKRLIRHLIWEQKQKDEGLPHDKKARIHVQNNVVFVNKQPVKRKLPAVRPHHYLLPDDELQAKLEGFEFVESKRDTVKFSTFQAYALKCSTVDDAHLAHVRVKQMNAEATHVVAAFVPKEGSGLHYSFQDDNEYGAGLKLVRFIKEQGLDEVAVYLVRNYGGFHLGPSRYQIMLKHAKEAMDKL